MDTASVIVPVLGVIFVAAFVRGALGFGDALVGMPLLVLCLSLPVATPLMALVSFILAISMLATSWRQVDVHSAWRLVVGSLPGIPLGLLLLKSAPSAIAETVLGLVLIGFGLYSLLGPRLAELKDERTAVLFGFVAGVLGGAYNSNGPPAVIYGALRRWSPERFRATMQGYFLPTGLVIMAGHGLGGLWTGKVLSLFAYCLPVVAVARWLGGRAARRLSGEQFQRFVYGFLVLMGVVLLVRAWS
jgi:uncharacterized membrane protein YfcA